VRFTENEMGLTIRVPKDKRQDIDTIVELEVK
jgi:hypothetical protein